MSTTIFHRTAIICSTLLLGTLAAPASAAGKYNVLFMIADDLNCDLGCYGHPLVKSPNIDRLAGLGRRFERAYCQYPLCGPSRAAFMCGLYPDQTRIHANAIRIRETLPEVQTMAQMFRKHGYTAARVGKIYHYNVPADIGTDGHDDPASWDRVVNPRGRDKDDEDRIVTARPDGRGTFRWMAAEGADPEQTDGIGAGEAIKLLEEYSANKTPFFLGVGFYRPHTPFIAPKQYFDMYPPETIRVPTVRKGYRQSLPEAARATLTGDKELENVPADTPRRVIQAYYASISFMDAQVGHVLDALDRLGLRQNTIVVFTSDHGYHMGEHGHWQKRTLFENGTHVPLVIVVPGMKSAGQSTAALAEMIDFYPTLAELCGLTAPSHLSGVSLASAVDDPAARPRSAALTQFGTGYALRGDRYRYVEWGEDGRDGAELYDHASDPKEMVNLAGRAEHAKTVTELSDALHARIRKARQVPAGLKQLDERPPAKKLKGT